MISVNQDTGELNVDRDVVLDVIMYVTDREPVPVNPYGGDRDVTSVNQDTGELNVSGHVVLDVIIMNATRMEDAPVSLFIGQETTATNVEKGTGDQTAIRDVAEDVLMYVTGKENVPVRLVTGQDRIYISLKWTREKCDKCEAGY